MSERIAVIGLGYVGLPVAMAFARKYPTVGFDIDVKRVDGLRAGEDRTREVTREELLASELRVSRDAADLQGSTFFVVTVPTPIDTFRQPDLRAVIAASETVGRALTKGAVVVYESTVYPGVTEDICGPVLERVSGLKRGRDFTLGYSPERINPGDKLHRLETIQKVVSGEDAATLRRVSAAYGSIVTAGVHEAPSIKVAEAAKVIENTQRDLNIALMNELALIFERMGISTRDVLAASRTKWNFLPFSPGLVGGHCIGVDPYYLTAKAESLGYHPQVILAGRRINDAMGAHVAERVVKGLSKRGFVHKGARVGILGLTFKEDVPDLRNSRVPDIVTELREYGIEPLVYDPHADAEEARHEYGLELAPISDFRDLHGLVLAVSHRALIGADANALLALLRPDGVFFDVKSVLDPARVPPGILYSSL